ncbi:hypothetical protein D3C80_958350 [compost metagenome]
MAYSSATRGRRRVANITGKIRRDLTAGLNHRAEGLIGGMSFVLRCAIQRIGHTTVFIVAGGGASFKAGYLAFFPVVTIDLIFIL